MKKQQGFNLIELMIVLVIVGILTAIAIPAYQDYTIRARVTEGLNLASAAKIDVAEAFISQGVVNNQEAAGYVSPMPTSNVENITIADDQSGKITITYTQIAGNGTLVLTPKLAVNQPITWTCTEGTLEKRYRPSNCR